MSLYPHCWVVCLASLSALLQYSFGQTLAPNREVNRPPLITRNPHKIFAFRVGHAFELPCEAEGFPSPSYEWFMDGKEFDPSGNDGRVAVQPGVGTLIFAEPLPRDEAFYQCHARNIMGIAVSVNAYLRLSYLDPFPVSGDRRYHPKIGDSLTLPCIAPVSYPKPTLYWAILDGNNLRQIYTNDRISVDYTGALHIANILEADRQGGKPYVCIAHNNVVREIEQGNRAIVSPQGQTEQFNAPEIVYHRSTDEVALLGQRFSVLCIFSGNPTPIVSWAKIGAVNDELPDGAETEDYGQTLTFVSVRYEHAGIYQCTGQNEVGFTPSQKSVALKIQATARFAEGWKPSSMEVGEHESATFFCKGEGIPEPETFWLINGVKLEAGNKDPNRLVEIDKLTFFNVTKADSKVIQCNVTNKHGYDFANAYLNVMEEAPVIEEPPQVDQKVAEGQTINLTCRVYGAPKPEIVWRRGSGEQLTGGRYKIYSDGNLLVEDVSLVDAGDYSCTATNRIDSVIAYGNLVVRRKTSIQTEPQDVMVEMGTEAKFTCTATTDPSEIENLRIIWKKDGQVIDYNRAQRVFNNDFDKSLTISGTISLDTGKYTCMAFNGIDYSEAGAMLIVQEPPDPPSKISIKCEPHTDENNPDITRILAEISWQPGRDNYAPILYYKLQYNTTFSPDTWYDIHPARPDDHQVVITGPNGTNTTIPASEPLPGFLPNATRYDYLLSPFGNYTFRVIARNKVGFSDPSEHSTMLCRTEPDVPYKNPENVIAEGDQPDNLVIFWTPMAEIEHNGPAFKYIVSWEPEDGSTPMKSDTVGRADAWHYVVRGEAGMDTYKKYRVRVKAKNSKGEANVEAPWVWGYTGEGVPLVRPTDVTVRVDSVDDTTAVLTWSQVDTDEDQVKGYFKGYRIQFARDSEWPENIREEDVIINQGRLLYPRPRYKREILQLNQTIHYRIRNLPPNTQVRLQIRVLNKYYVGKPSDAITFRTMEGEPGPPAKFDVIARGPTFFILTWEPPKQTNGVLQGYHISYQIVSGLNLGGLQVREIIEPFEDDEQPTIRLAGLKPETYYRVFLMGSTRTGQGEPIFLDMNTLPAGIPSPPTFDIVDHTDNSFTAQWEASRGSNPGSVFFVEYRIRGYYMWQRTEQEYLTNYYSIWPVDSGTVYQVRVVATNGMGDEAASEWLEVQTEGITPGRFKLSVSFWFYGIFISLIIIIAFIIIFIFAKKKTDVWHYDKEEEIDDHFRQIRADEAVQQMGIFNQDSREYMYSQGSFGAELKPQMGDRSYEVAEDVDDPDYYLRQAPQNAEFPPEPPYSAQSLEPAPPYDSVVQERPYQPPVAPKPKVTDEYAVVQKKPKRSVQRLERSEGERGSKDTFV